MNFGDIGELVNNLQSLNKKSQGPVQFSDAQNVQLDEQDQSTKSSNGTITIETDANST